MENSSCMKILRTFVSFWMLCVENSQRKSEIHFAFIDFCTSNHQPLEARALLVHLNDTFAKLSQRIVPILINFSSFIGLLFAATRKTLSSFARKIANEKLFSNRNSRDKFSAREFSLNEHIQSLADWTENSLRKITGKRWCKFRFLRTSPDSLFVLRSP